ncbi:MAG: hypothetical protein KDE27_25700 [Planctomycetes bacterium]|nr:hypothetical protein [Planctomycetota bacterium]
MKTPGVATRSFLVLALSLGIAPAQDGPGPLRMRAYDVRDIVRREPAYVPAAFVDATSMPCVDDTAEDADSAVDIADLVTLVVMATGYPYWDGDGVEIRAEDSGFLAIVCDEQMHAQVRNALGKLRGLLFEPVLIEVHELPGSVLRQRSAVLSATEADALLAEVGEHRVHAGRANPRRPLLLESKRIENHVTGLKMLVAQNAAAPDLKVATDNYGSSWQVRTERTLDDSLLVTFSGSERALEPGPVCSLPVANGDVAAVELPAVRIATCHSSAYLHPGQALLLGSDAPGGGAFCVRIQRTAAVGELDLGEVVAYPVANLVRGAAVPIDLPVPYGDVGLFPELDEEPLPTVFDDGRLVEWLTSQVDPATWDGSPNTMSFANDHLFVSAPAATQKAIVEQLQALQSLDARQFVLEVAFGEVPKDTPKALAGVAAEQLAAALPQRCTAVVSPSRAARLSATWHTPIVADSDVVIAAGSAATTSKLDSITKGFLLRAGVASMDRGAVLLDLNFAMLGHSGERALLAQPAVGFAPVDRIDVRDHRVRGATAVTVGEWTVLQLAPVAGGRGHVGVVARLRST